MWKLIGLPDVNLRYSEVTSDRFTGERMDEIDYALQKLEQINRDYLKLAMKLASYLIEQEMKRKAGEAPPCDDY
jgi:hypothetical protein